MSLIVDHVMKTTGPKKPRKNYTLLWIWGIAITICIVSYYWR
jgi:hypothetical protein